MSTPSNRVAIQSCGHISYPETPPFHPAVVFPEYPFATHGTQPKNWVYGEVRECLRILGFDAKRFGTSDWNPLGHLIPVGGKVVIKPNLVISEHELGVEGLLASVAHGSIVRALVDYAYIACGPSGQITICDSPIKEVDFAKITSISGIKHVVDFFGAITDLPRPDVRLLDIRDLQAFRDASATIVDWIKLQGDPLGYTVVDLKDKSMLAEIGNHSHRLRSTAAIYENEASKRHSATMNQYSFPNTILEADAVISIAKLKVHRKAGVTLSLKNMVGSTNEKRWLPHHRAGTPSKGGDMTPDGAPPDRKLKEAVFDRLGSHGYGRFVRRFFLPSAIKLWKTFRLQELVRLGRGRMQWDWTEGDWNGNDTIWRTTLDLNMALRYADRAGRITRQLQRNFFCVIDGVIGGDREGPLHPRPRPCGVIVAGEDAVAVDTVCCALMGLDPARIPTLAKASKTPYYVGSNNFDTISISSNDDALTRWRSTRWKHFHFEPSAGWVGSVELEAGSSFYSSDSSRWQSEVTSVADEERL